MVRALPTGLLGRAQSPTEIGSKSEGVELECKAMGEGTKPKTPIIVEMYPIQIPWQINLLKKYLIDITMFYFS